MRSNNKLTVGPVIFPKPYATVQVSATTNDNGLKVRMLPGSNVFSLKGEAAATGKALTVTIDGKKVTVPLTQGTKATQVAELLRKALPEGYTLVAPASEDGTLNVRLTKNLVAPGPKIEVGLANDPTQRVLVTGNTISISGVASNNGIGPSMLNLSIEGQRISLSLNGGDDAKATAQALLAALPTGLKGQIELKGSSAVITVLRA